MSAPVRGRSIAFLLTLFLAWSVSTVAQKKTSAAAPAASSASVPSDPLLKAMREELDRSKTATQDGECAAALLHRISAIGCGRIRCRGRVRRAAPGSTRACAELARGGARRRLQAGQLLRPGTGVVNLAPLDDDSIALRRELWLATDRAYKSATEALASKKAALSQYTAGQPFDDFAKAPAIAIARAAGEVGFHSRAVEGIAAKSHRSLPHRREDSIAFRFFAGFAR